jgi:DNA-binding response OmpR family regulator
MTNRKINVLIVDDHEDTVAMFRTWLAAHGYSGFGLTDLPKMEHMLRTEDIDVLLLDLMFPGAEATDEIRKIRSKFPNLRIVVISGTSDLNLTRRAIDAGADSYMTKPIDWDVLPTLLGDLRVA